MIHFHTLFDYIYQKSNIGDYKSGKSQRRSHTSYNVTTTIVEIKITSNIISHTGGKAILCHTLTGEKQYYGRLHESDQWWSHATPLFVTPITQSRNTI